MRKRDFLEQLRGRLSGLPREELEERLAFYHEMIDDRMEEGLSEEEAVQAVGTLEEIMAQILEESAAGNSQPESTPAKRKMKAWEFVLLALGSPVWVSLLVASFAVVLALGASLWAVIASLWVVFAAAIYLSFGCLYWVVAFIIGGQLQDGMLMLSIALISAGLGIFLFFGCKLATKGAVLLTKKSVCATKLCFGKKEAA